MSFLDSVAADNRNVFLNCDEFAELRTVVYDGVTHADIPVVLTHQRISKTFIPVTEHTEGLKNVTATAHIALEDLGGLQPEEGQRIRISDGRALGLPFFRRYKILTSAVALGMLTLELESIED